MKKRWDRSATVESTARQFTQHDRSVRFWLRAPMIFFLWDWRSEGHFRSSRVLEWRREFLYGVLCSLRKQGTFYGFIERSLCLIAFSICDSRRGATVNNLVNRLDEVSYCSSTVAFDSYGLYAPEGCGRCRELPGAPAVLSLFTRIVLCSCCQQPVGCPSTLSCLFYVLLSLNHCCRQTSMRIVSRVIGWSATFLACVNTPSSSLNTCSHFSLPRRYTYKSNPFLLCLAWE
jgi:hypothetical protein